MPELISPLELANEEPAEPQDSPPDAELDAVRAVVLQAYPDVVPELVTGDSVAALLASVEPARSAYARLAETWSAGRTPEAARVPAGGGTPIAVDPERLPAAEKIRRGLAASAPRHGVQKG